MLGGYNHPPLYHSEGMSLHVHPRVNSFWWRQVSVRGHLAFLSPTLFCLHELLRLFTPRLATTWRHASIASLSKKKRKRKTCSSPPVDVFFLLIIIAFNSKNQQYRMACICSDTFGDMLLKLPLDSHPVSVFGPFVFWQYMSFLTNRAHVIW